MSSVIEVAIGVLIDDVDAAQRVLIARRPKAGVLGGYWEFPGGKIESGETAERCVVREFEEELGVRVSVRDRLDVIEHVYDHGRVRLHPFMCGWEGGALANRAVSEHRWVLGRELASYRFPPANDGLLVEVAAWLEQEHGRGD